jgi:dienelactone hydrolase
MSAVIKDTHLIGGIHVNVYKRSESIKQPQSVAILFLLHGRKGSAKDMDPTARAIIEKVTDQQQRKLWVVTLDHRNHGERLLDSRANRSWADKVGGNILHAMDLYSIQTGTAEDVSFLIDFLPIYLFPNDDCRVDAWGVAGKSLGGHSTWIALSRDPRITIGIPIIGCPNYLKLMIGRAQKNSIPFEAPQIPNSLISLINRSDPASKDYTSLKPSNPFLGKKILILSGKEDRLVPWKVNKSFVDALEVGPEGVKKVSVKEGVGHTCTDEMVDEAAAFIGQYLLTVPRVPPLMGNAILR